MDAQGVLDELLLVILGIKAVSEQPNLIRLCGIGSCGMTDAGENQFCAKKTRTSRQLVPFPRGREWCYEAANNVRRSAPRTIQGRQLGTECLDDPDMLEVPSVLDRFDRRLGHA